MDTIRRIVSQPMFDQVQSLLMEGDIQLNKELLLITRHMGLSAGFGNFATLTSNATDRLYNLPFFKARGSHHDSNFPDSRITQKLNDFFSNPLYAGGIIMSSFLAPLSPVQVEEIRLQSYFKEVNIMDTDAYDETLDFSPFFGKYGNSLHPTMSPNPKMAKRVHETIDR